MIGTGDAQTDWNLIMPPRCSPCSTRDRILLMQRWFVKGLVETEK